MLGVSSRVQQLKRKSAALRGVDNTDNVAPKANQLANFPLNFLRTGYYNYSDGKVYFRTTYGTWWSATRSSATGANYLTTHTTAVLPQDSGSRGNGFAVPLLRAEQNRDHGNSYPGRGHRRYAYPGCARR
jgi:hypothetical protein